MNYLSFARKQGVTVVIGTPPNKAILETITQLALIGNVLIVAGSSSPFDVKALAKEVRRHTSLQKETMTRVQIIRPLTCIQTIKALDEIEPTAAIVILDMLTTFYDESVPDTDSFRLTHIATGRIRQLGQQTPVLITLKPAATPNRAGLIKIMRGVATRVYVFETPEEGGQMGVL